MSQCVPSWDLDESSAPPRVNLHGHSNSSNSFASAVPSLDEVAELTWENGQLSMHGLGPRVVNKPTVSASPSKYTTWDKPPAGGTLESIVNQATRQPILPKSAGAAAAIRGGDHSASKSNLVPWIEHRRATTANPAASASVTMTMDALVPCNNNNIRRSTDNQEHSSHVLDPTSGIGKCMVGSSTRVGSCSGAAAGTTLDGGVGTGRRVVGMISCRSVSESDTCDGGRDSRQITLDTCEREYFGVASPENTFSGKEYTRTSGDDHDSVSHSRSQRERGDNVVKKKGNGKSSSSTKRSRAAAIHNQSERKRRDKINQRMKTLQKLVPNSSKTDKASMLTEVIEYLKQLQAQVSMMSRMNMSPMMLPLAMQQQLQMSMMAASPMGMGMGMGMAGMGMGVMDINNISRAAGMMPPAAAAFMPPVPSWDNPLTGDSLQMPPPGPVMPDPALAAFLACQSQPMTMDAYSRLAALYQQFQPRSASGPASASGPKH